MQGAGQAQPPASCSILRYTLSTKKGLFLYDAKRHALEQVVREDVRGAAGRQEFVKHAPVNLIYVADFERMGGSSGDKVFYSAANTGGLQLRAPVRVYQYANVYRSRFWFILCAGFHRRGAYDRL